MEPKKQRVIIYVDGFNFYYGLKSKSWRKYYWLDIVKFFQRFMKPYQELVHVNYFSARSHSAKQAKRQDAFFSANNINPQFNLHLGRYLQKEVFCTNCETHFNTFEEKETDVRIAVTLIADAIKNECDISIIVSGDSDLTPPIRFIREAKPSHKIFVYFPPNRYSANLDTLADNTKSLQKFEAYFNESLLPEEVTLLSGYKLKKPAEWI